MKRKEQTNDTNTFVIVNDTGFYRCLSHRTDGIYCFTGNPGEAWAFSRNRPAAEAQRLVLLRDGFKNCFVTTRQEARKLTGYVLQETKGYEGC